MHVQAGQHDRRQFAARRARAGLRGCRAALAAAASILGICASSAAIAQTAAPGPAAPQAATSDPAAPAATGLADIVVTAQRRSESLSRVPIAVTAISSDALRAANIQEPSQLVLLTPSLQRETTNNQVGSTNFAVRGIGTAVYGPQIESSVAIVIDDVTMARPQFGIIQFFDIDRVEVLRGPQGMLFGKNASAGLVSIVTGQPRIGVSEGAASINYGHRDTDHGANQVTVNAVENIPVTENSALRISGFFTHDDGFIRNDYRPGEFLGLSEFGVRGKYLWEPNSHWRVLIEGDYVHETGAANSVFARRFDAPGGFVASRDKLYGITPSTQNIDQASNDDTTNSFETGGGQLNVSYKTDGGLTFTNIAAYRRYYGSAVADLDFTPDSFWNATVVDLDYHQFSDEFRVSSPTTGPLQYQAGLYFLDLYAGGDTTLRLNLSPLSPVPAAANTFNLGSYFVPTSKNRSYAAFGQATYSFTDKLRLTAGGRFTHDDTSFTNFFYASHGAETYLSTLYGVRSVANQQKADNFSWRLIGQYDLAPGVMSYLSWSRGYKGPGFDLIGANLVRPEISYNLEAGLKAVLLDRRLTFNLALFNQNIHDFQAQALSQQYAGFTTLNAGNLRSRGVEFEIRAKPLPILTVGGGVTYNNAKYASFAGAPCYTGEPVGTSGTNVCLPNGTTDASGNQLANAPRWTATATAAIDDRLTDTLSYFLGSDLYFRTASSFDPAGDPRSRIATYALLGFNVGVRANNDAWRLSVFVRNVTDKRVPTYIFSDPLAGVYGDAAKGGNYWQQFDENAFRTIGANLSFKF